MKKIIAFLIPLSPFSALAAQPSTTGIENIMALVKKMADSLIPLFMVVVVAIFMWGIIKYVTSSGDEEKRKSAQGYIIYGLLGIFVMVAFYGIITLVAGSFGISTGSGTIQQPTLPQ